MDLQKISQKLQEMQSKNRTSFDVDYVGLKENVVRSVLNLIDAMFPGYTKFNFEETDYLKEGYEFLKTGFSYLMSEEESIHMADQLVEKLPTICQALQDDVVAAYEGDPACKSVDEIILCYPAFLAISVYRIAHEIYLLGQPLIARMMSEYAHQKTGIDIHPGATIGKHFFIDHGTGVVVGETTIIGDKVKLYQHVTLGAKSFPVADDGSLVKDLKRHPNIGNDVVIYAGATILGGDTYIGDHCVIGGNVWLTHSVPAGKTVMQNNNPVLSRDNG